VKKQRDRREEDEAEVRVPPVEPPRWKTVGRVPVEYTLLMDMPEPMDFCPACGFPFRSFMRGMVQCWFRRWLKRPYCCIICDHCKEIVGYEYGQ